MAKCFQYFWNFYPWQQLCYPKLNNFYIFLFYCNVNKMSQSNKSETVDAPTHLGGQIEAKEIASLIFVSCSSIYLRPSCATKLINDKHNACKKVLIKIQMELVNQFSLPLVLTLTLSKSEYKNFIFVTKFSKYAH